MQDGPGAGLPARAVERAPLERDPGHVLPQAHKQDALAVQDLQAPDGLSPPLWEELDLFQHTAPRGRSQRRPHLLNGAMICRGSGGGRTEEGQRASQPGCSENI